MFNAIKTLISRGYYAPAGDEGSAGDGGKKEEGAVDRGDDVKSPLDNAGKDDKGAEDDAGKDADKAKGDKLDPDGEETEDEKAERIAAEAAEEAKKRIRIPKHRFDEAQAKARKREEALLGEIEKLKGGQASSAAQKQVGEMRGKIEELQDKYEDLILEGKKDEARVVRKKVDAMREELSDYQTSVKSDAARRSAIDEMSYNASLAGLEAQYPALNPEHEAFDEEATSEIATVMDGLVKTGMARAKALAKAVKYVLGAPAAKEDEGKKDDTDAKKLAAQKAEDARKKAADAQKRQPGDMKGVGKDSDKAGGKGEGDIDVLKLSQKNFAKLDDETKAKLRGDVV